MSNAVEEPEPVDELEADVDDAIHQAGGLRQAIRGLILGQRSMQLELSGTVSAGYVRRKPRTL